MPANAAAIERGRKNYQTAGCAKCHGAAGQGDGPEAKRLKTDWNDEIRPTDLTNPSAYIGGTTPREMYRTMMAGPAGTPMPPGDLFFDTDEAWDVVAYIQSLQER